MRVMSVDTVYSAAASSAVPQSAPKSARRATPSHWSCSSSRPLDIMVILQNRYVPSQDRLAVDVFNDSPFLAHVCESAPI